MTRRFRAPAADRAILADPPFDQIPALVERNRQLLNRAEVRIGGVPLNDLRKQARAEILGHRTDSPLLITGHQPELFHPGVWVKNFALNGLAKKLGGVPLHLIADHDTMKSASIMLPTWDEWAPESVRLDKAAFDEFDTEQPWEMRTVRKPEQWDEFVTRVRVAGQGWGYEPLLLTPLSPGGRGVGGEGDVYPPPANSCGVDDLPLKGGGAKGGRSSNHATRKPGGLFTSPLAGEVGDGVSRRRVGGGETWSSLFTTLRTNTERAWGCDNREAFVSQLSQTESFRRFARHIAADDERFRHAYNSAVRKYRTDYKLHSHSHPVPDLTANELPFWVVEGDTRRAATATDIDLSLRPRALTLTLFARLCLGDLFTHGIGGGKYDEVTDTIIRDYFGLEPPAYQVLSATLHLPLPTFPATADDVNRLHRLRRELDWESERHIDPREATELKRRKQDLIADRSGTPSERRQRYRELLAVKEKLREFVGYYTPEVDRQLSRARAEVAANAILLRRDFSWVLYPEAVLKPFLQGFL